MVLQEIIRKLNEICPFDLQEEFDNSGLQVGRETSPCETLLLALDLTPAVMEEAITKKAEVIITHHPLLFHGLKSVAADTWPGQAIYRLIENNIALISLHTNLDKIDYGVNLKLAQDLGLKELRLFLPDEDDGNIGLGAVGNLEKAVPLATFCETVKERLRQPFLKYVGSPQRLVRKIGVLGGAGAQFIPLAAEQKLDVYLSGDFKYHDAQKAHNFALCLIDAGHFSTEAGVIANLHKKLEAEFADLKVLMSENIIDYWQYV